MESIIKRIEVLFRTEISHLKELLDCVSLETDNLINLNIETLWSLMAEKKRILQSIEDIRGEIGHLLKKGDTDHDISRERQHPIMKLSRTIADLKEEIKARVRENVLFINESLDCFNEIFSIFATGGRADHSYRPAGKSRRELARPIYYREV